MMGRSIEPFLYWLAVALMLPLAGVFVASEVAGDDLSPIVFILFQAPILAVLALTVAGLGAARRLRGRAPPWLAPLLLATEAVVVLEGGPLWRRWGERIAFSEVRTDFARTVGELEAGRPPTRMFGAPEVLARGPLRVTFKAGWHRFTYDGGDRPVAGCLRIAPYWSACPLFSAETAALRC